MTHVELGYHIERCVRVTDQSIFDRKEIYFISLAKCSYNTFSLRGGTEVNEISFYM